MESQIIRREIRRKKMNDFYHEMGLLYGIGFTGIFFLVASALYGFAKLAIFCMFFGILFVASTKLIMKGEGIMGYVIKKALGILENQMKLQAVADFLKVKFVHIPEHYKCKELKSN